MAIDAKHSIHENQLVGLKMELTHFSRRGIPGDLLEKYASDGELQFTPPDVLKLPPISQRGNVNEIIGKFGGADQLRTAVNQLHFSMLKSQQPSFSLGLFKGWV